MSTKKNAPPESPPTAPAPRREHWRTAPPTIRDRVDGWISRGQCMRAVQSAVVAGYRIDRSDLLTPITDRMAAIDDPGARAQLRLRNSVQAADEAAAIAKIQALEIAGWNGRTIAEEAQRHAEKIRNIDAQRAARVNQRIAELRAQRAAEEAALLRSIAEATTPRGAA